MLYGKSFMFWFLSIRFGPEYFSKMNISVDMLTVKNVILAHYILLKSALKLQEMPF